MLPQSPKTKSFSFILPTLRFFLSVPPEENHRQDGEREDEDQHEVSRFYTNPIARPIPQPAENSLHKHHNNVDDTIVALNMRAALRNGLEGSSEDASFHDDSLQDEREEEPEIMHHLHPAGKTGAGVGVWLLTAFRGFQCSPGCCRPSAFALCFPSFIL